MIHNGTMSWRRSSSRRLRSTAHKSLAESARRNAASPHKSFSILCTPEAYRSGLMRNLVATKDRSVGLALPEELGEASTFAVDSDGGLLFIAGTGLGVAACTAADGEVGGRLLVHGCYDAVLPMPIAWRESRWRLSPPAACRLPPAACRLPPAACRLHRR